MQLDKMSVSCGDLLTTCIGYTKCNVSRYTNTKIRTINYKREYFRAHHIPSVASPGCELGNAQQMCRVAPILVR